MPYLNARGDVLMGIGDGIVSINGRVIDEGGAARWLDDERVIYRRKKDQQVHITDTDISLGFGANEIAAGGGQWAAWTAGEGLRHSRDGRLFSAGLLDVGRDGTLAFCPDRQSGQGIRFLALQDSAAQPGTERRRFTILDSETAAELHCHSWGNAVWKAADGRTVAMIGGVVMGIPSIAPVFKPRLVRVADQWWLLYNTNEEPHARTLLQRVGSDLGHMVWIGDRQFAPDVREKSPGVLHIVWASREGERPEDLVEIEFTFEGKTAQPLTRTTKPTPTPIPTPLPQPQPNPTEPPMPIAHNSINIVRQVIAAHPEIDPKEEGPDGRGRITDYVVLALGGRPWGRKDRDRDPHNRNNSDDALCFLRPDGKFEIYDILSGSDGSATWDYAGTFADGENGYFRDVIGTVPPVDPRPDPDGDDDDINAKLDAILSAIQTFANVLQTVVDRETVVVDFAPLTVKLNGIAYGVISVQQQLDRGFDAKILGQKVHFAPTPR